VATPVTFDEGVTTVHYLPIIFVSDPDGYRSGNDGHLAPTAGRGVPTWIWESPSGSRRRRRALKAKRRR